MSCVDDAWVSFGRRDRFGLDWVQLLCEEAQPACRRGGSDGHLLFCWGHYGSPLSHCWSVLAAHRCSSTPADKYHLSRWFQRSWLGLLEGQVDNSDAYSQTAPQSLAPAGKVMPSGNEWIGGSHHLYHMPCTVRPNSCTWGKLANSIWVCFKVLLGRKKILGLRAL